MAEDKKWENERGSYMYVIIYRYADKDIHAHEQNNKYFKIDTKVEPNTFKQHRCYQQDQNTALQMHCPDVSPHHF